VPDEAVRILVVDDFGAVIGQLIRNVLRELPGVEVVGAAKERRGGAGADPPAVAPTC